MRSRQGSGRSNTATTTDRLASENHRLSRGSIVESHLFTILLPAGSTLAVLKRVGWMRDSVKPGDVVTVVGNPYKDGRRTGGSFNYVVLPDGKHLGTGDAIPGALVPSR